MKMYLGAYAQPGEAGGIRRYSLDSETGKLAMEAEYSGLANPSWLLHHPRRAVLYAVEELAPEGRIAALSVAGGKIELLRTFPSGGADPCHLSLSPDARNLFAANYTSGSLAVFALDDAGVPVRRTDFVQHRLDAPGVDPIRQEGAHVHFSLCDGERVFVCDLGMDAVFVYGWDAERGRLVDRGERIRLPGGAGPRHLAFGAGQRCLYVLCELSSEVHAFAREAGGAWRHVQAVSMLPEDFGGCGSTGAAIRVLDGGTLCASNRGHDSLAFFRIAADGRLCDRRIIPSGGRTPRDVQAVGDCLLAANQDDGSLAVFKRDAAGEYALIRRETVAGNPSCICTVPGE